LVRTIKAHLDKGQQAKDRSDQAKDKSDQHFTAAGQYLKVLKAEHTSSWAEWEELLKTQIGISTGRASELMQIADGRKTVEKLRADRADGMRQVRAASSPRGEETKDKPEDSAEAMKAKFAELDAEADQDDDGDSEEACWRRGLLNRATGSAGGALYEDWSSYVVDDELVAKAEQAAVAWTSTAEYLRRLRDAQSGRANVVTTFAADLAERAENATVVSPAAEPAEPADVIEPDNGDGVLVWSSDQG
jgi:hypothetical protein